MPFLLSSRSEAFRGNLRELEIKPRGVMVPEDCCEHVGAQKGCHTSHPTSSTCGDTFQFSLVDFPNFSPRSKSFQICWKKLLTKKKLPKEYAGFLLFSSIDFLLRGHDHPDDFAEELIVIKLHGTQDTVKVLAALEHGAIYARVTINALKTTSSYFNLLFLCIPELWSLANWSALKNFKYSINFKLL